MNMIPVTSSNIKAIGWEGNKILFDGSVPKDILRVEYSHGAVYEYYGVSKEVFQGLLDAESKGKFLNQNIRDKYMTVKVV